MSTASIQSQSIAHVTIAGVYYGKFDVHDPIEVKAEIIRHRDGGSPTETLIAVPPSTQPITVKRLYKAERDQALRALRTQINADATLGLQDLDASMNAFGAVDPVSGLFSGYKGPDGDSSGNEKRWVELTFELV
jgi:hypothetical protein